MLPSFHLNITTIVTIADDNMTMLISTWIDEGPAEPRWKIVCDSEKNEKTALLQRFWPTTISSIRIQEIRAWSWYCEAAGQWVWLAT